MAKQYHINKYRKQWSYRIVMHLSLFRPRGGDLGHIPSFDLTALSQGVSIWPFASVPGGTFDRMCHLTICLFDASGLGCGHLSKCIICLVASFLHFMIGCPFFQEFSRFSQHEIRNWDANFIKNSWYRVGQFDRGLLTEGGYIWSKKIEKVKLSQVPPWGGIMTSALCLYTHFLSW